MPALLVAALLAAEAGAFPVTLDPGEAAVPEPYRLEARTVPYTLTPAQRFPLSGARMDRLTFPSQVETPFESNNTVHAEYYRPAGAGPFPVVVILDVLAGDQILSRTMGQMFARNGVAGLFVQMAYYGPRRPKESRVRLLTPDLLHTSRAIQQSVIDCRCAVRFLQSRPEVVPSRVGIVGTSMGSFIAGLTGAMEPRLDRVALLLGGGGIVDAYFDHPRATALRVLEGVFPGTKDTLREWLAPIDSLTYADRLGKRRLLLIAASRDDIVPGVMARRLWEATGRQRIVWLDTTHYGSALFAVPIMRSVLDYFREP